MKKYALFFTFLLANFCLISGESSQLSDASGLSSDSETDDPIVVQGHQPRGHICLPCGVRAGLLLGGTPQSSADAVASIIASLQSRRDDLEDRVASLLRKAVEFKDERDDARRGLAQVKKQLAVAKRRNDELKANLKALMAVHGERATRLSTKRKK